MQREIAAARCSRVARRASVSDVDQRAVEGAPEHAGRLNAVAVHVEGRVEAAGSALPDMVSVSVVATDRLKTV
jgi:hypothetical protein